jgi:23S rRNA (guanosine2251-2'-O)-methyltransferase
LLLGVHSCVEALRAGRRRVFALLVKSGAERRPEVRDLIRLAKERGLPIRNLDLDLVERPEVGNPQGVGLEVGPLPELAIEDLVAPSDEPRRLVILDGVEDPQNVGALARVAEGSGVKGMVLSKRRAPPLSPALARASAGAIEWLPVARVTNLARAIKYLKKNGFWVVGADVSATESLYGVPDHVLQGDLAVVLGAEGKGLRPEVKKLVDHPVRIDMQGQVASLNVAAAGAVLLFELLRRAETHAPRQTRTRSGPD